MKRSPLGSRWSHCGPCRRCASLARGSTRLSRRQNLQGPCSVRFRWCSFKLSGWEGAIRIKPVVFCPVEVHLASRERNWKEISAQLDFFCKGSGKVIYFDTSCNKYRRKRRHKKGENLIHGWLLYAPDDSIDLIYAVDATQEKYFLHWGWKLKLGNIDKSSERFYFSRQYRMKSWKYWRKCGKVLHLETIKDEIRPTQLTFPTFL